MKKIIYIFLAITLGIFSVNGMPEATSGQDSITIYTTPELTGLVNAWSDKFMSSEPGKSIIVRPVASGQKILNGNITIVSDRELATLSTANPSLRIIVGRNVVVPIMNSSNPFFTQIHERGISPEKFKMMAHGGYVKWSEILEGGSQNSLILHYLNDRSVVDALNDFMGADPANTTGSMHENPAEVFSALAREIYSVGICRLSDLQDPANAAATANISIIPIDRNGNGTIDSNEDIYSDMTEFARGVWIGKYPKALFTNIYSITEAPVNQGVSAFFEWIITGGQNVLAEEGYTGLIITERMSDMNRIAEARPLTPAVLESGNIFRTLLVVVLILSAVALITGFLMKTFGKQPVQVPDTAVEAPVIDEKSLLLPKGMYFDKTHTWAFMEQDGAIKVGIDDFMLHITGPVSRIKMKKAGERVKKGDEILSLIRNGKQLNLYSPVTGVIKELNSALESDVDILNSSPYNKGWVYRVEPENWQRENQLLFMADKQRKFIMNEVSRIKDFLATVLHNPQMQYSPVILQDGGMLREGVLADMNPQVWEEFQTKIIDPSRTVWFYEII